MIPTNIRLTGRFTSELDRRSGLDQQARRTPIEHPILHGIHAAQNRPETEGEKSARSRAVVMKIARQMATDYLVFFGGEALAVAPDNNGRERGRECCAHSVGVYGDFCALCGRGGEVHRGRGRGGKQPDWCIRQMLGTANFQRRPTGVRERNLCDQFEHHLFPDLRSNRYAQIATRGGAVRTSSTFPTPPARRWASICRWYGPSISGRCRIAF